MTQNVRNGAGAGSNDFMLLPGGKGKAAEASGRDFESFLNPGLGSITKRADIANRRTDVSGIGSSQTAKSRAESPNTERTGQDRSTQGRADKTENRVDTTAGQEGQNTVKEPGEKAGKLEESKGSTDPMEDVGEEPSEEAMEALVTSVLEFLNGIAEEVVSVDPEAIQDWMQENGMSLSDMLNPENLRQMVLDLNGLSDAAGFLTDADALAEWNEIQARLAELLGGNETAVEDLRQFELSGQSRPAEMVLPTDLTEQVGEEPELLLYEEAVPQVSGEEAADSQQAKAETQTGGRDSVPGGERQSTRTDDAGQSSLANVFLNQMHEALGNAIEALDAGVQVRQTEILDQVMNQIRVGISQEVTSMDFMLHPESLGRVHVAVLAKEGVMTAQLTVQSEEAKQALESQLVTLRQTFEDQGLKVESVEVNVSEFAFGEESQSSGQAKDGGTGSRRNRRFDYGTAVDPADGNEEASREELSPLEAQELEMAGAQVDYSA